MAEIRSRARPLCRDRLTRDSEHGSSECSARIRPIPCRSMIRAPTAGAADRTLNQLRSFVGGTDVGNTAVAVGGYNGVATIASVEINVASGGCASPTPTPTATPSCTPGGAPGPWTLVAPYPLIIESPAVSSAGTFGYSAGGITLTACQQNAFYRYDSGDECLDAVGECANRLL